MTLRAPAASIVEVEGLRAVVSSAALLALLLIFLLLGRMDATGPPHAELVLDGGVPATLYVAGSGAAGRSLPDPLPPAERPPGVVLAHGFAGDRAGVRLFDLGRREMHYLADGGNPCRLIVNPNENL